MLTQSLLFLIALLVAAGLWRLARWHWRPRLVLPDSPELLPDPEGIRVMLHVRNEGAGRSRGCRAVLVRCEKREDVGWLRFEPPGRAEPTDPGAGGQGIEPGGSAPIELDRALPDEPGEYRLEVAVLNGEEKRASYVIRM
jgi:hypothetical protein